MIADHFVSERTRADAAQKKVAAVHVTTVTCSGVVGHFCRHIGMEGDPPKEWCRRAGQNAVFPHLGERGDCSRQSYKTGQTGRSASGLAHRRAHARRSMLWLQCLIRSHKTANGGRELPGVRHRLAQAGRSPGMLSATK
jgi:hypothetical protein